MTKPLIILLAALLGLCAAGRSLEAVDFKGIDFPGGSISFADDVFDYSPGAGVGGAFANPSRALGEPDDSSMSLGNSGRLVLQFTDNYLTPSGDSSADLWIFELGLFEVVNLAISKNGTDWVGVGPTAEGQGIDIDVLADVHAGERYSYIELIDAGVGATVSDHAGADIDAVGAISTLPIPEPASILLMGTGLAGLLVSFRKD